MALLQNFFSLSYLSLFLFLPVYRWHCFLYIYYKQFAYFSEVPVCLSVLTLWLFVYLHLYLPDPFCNHIFRSFQMVFTHRIKLNLHFMCKGSSFALVLHIFNYMSRPFVINGITVFPVKSFTVKNVSTAGAIVYHHVGVPIASTS